MSDIKTAVIIGGGIAGPVAAMALQKAGIDAAVYEAHDSTADGVGGIIGLAPNGFNALGVIGVDDAVRRAGDPVSSMVMHSWTGRRLAEFGGADGPPILHAVWRAELCRVLYDEATRRGIRIERGKRFTTARDIGNGVTAQFADGSRASADILIGADGIRSAVRSLIDPAAPEPGYTGLVGVAGFTPSGVDVGLPATNGSMHMVYGKRAFFSYVVYPDGHAGWFANVPRKQPMTLAEARARGGETWLAELRELYAADRIPALDILRHMDPDDLVIVGGLYIMPPAPCWHRGRMVLVGDSAHVPSNTSGQGASQAIEGAIELAMCLRDLPTIEEAFAGYDRLRRPRVERITANARRAISEKTAGPVGRVLRDLVLPLAMKVLAKPEKMAWQVGYRIDWDANLLHKLDGIQATSRN